MMLADRRSLADLPPPSGDIFPLRHPWCPVSARVLTETLRIDHGLFGVWRLRGVGPQALPADWIKGHRHAYLISDALCWLAQRRGEPTEAVTFWQTHLATAAGMVIEDHTEVRRWAQRYARSAGPGAYVADGVQFARGGFEKYLESLLVSA
ncbi:hypothetical protein ACLBWX_01110 [Methylobacterium sp. M6A4_1b]